MQLQEAASQLTRKITHQKHSASTYPSAIDPK